MDKIRFEEQRIIDELVEFWQTRYEPCDLVAHIDQVSGIWGGGVDTSFFRQVFEDLRANKRSNYAASSASEFKQLLEDKYRRDQKKEKANFFRRRFEDLRADKRNDYADFSALELKQLVEAEYRQAQANIEAERQAQANIEAERQAQANIEAERQAQANIEAERQEYRRRARANFDALGKEMAKATTREELVELGQQRADLALATGFSFIYDRHCWRCWEPISSDIHARCPICKLYICSSCGSCFCGRATLS